MKLIDSFVFICSVFSPLFAIVSRKVDFLDSPFAGSTSQRLHARNSDPHIHNDLDSFERPPDETFVAGDEEEHRGQFSLFSSLESCFSPLPVLTFETDISASRSHLTLPLIN